MSCFIARKYRQPHINPNWNDGCTAIFVCMSYCLTIQFFFVIECTISISVNQAVIAKFIFVVQLTSVKLLGAITFMVY